MRWILATVRRLIGTMLVACAMLPVYRVLVGRETGLAGTATAEVADAFMSFLWMGTLVIGLCALLCGRLLPPDVVTRAIAGLAGALERPRTATWALATGALACGLAAAFSLLALDGRPNQLDAFTQLLHARFLAGGQLAGPVDGSNMFWHIQNSVVTARGWVSQYPPGHVLLLALGLGAGAAWLVGPLMTGVMVTFVALAADRLLPGRTALARAGALLVAFSTFVVCLGGSFMNHVSAAALIAAAVYFTVRAARDAAHWAFAAGAAAGAAFTIRPLTAIAIFAATAAAAWLHDARRAGALAMRASLGALPFVLALGAYNRWFFGRPTRFGYDAALGPATGLGFGRDPWGNVYGPIEALGYTSAELLTLGIALIETPISAVLIVGLFLLLVARLDSGERVLAAWALAPVGANLFYWHHGMYMGPRMLFESAPAWILLATIAIAAGYRALPVRFTLSGLHGFPRSALAGGTACALALGLLWLGPQRAAAHATPAGSVAGVRAPVVDTPALVFVHDAWTARLAMQLAGTGMRLDSVETILRQNHTCDVQELVDAVHSGDATLHARALQRLDMQPRASALPRIVRIAAGTAMRVADDRAMTPECVRQARADRLGILDLAPLVSQGDLPGAAPQGTLFVRDLGPGLNARLIRRMPARLPLVLFMEREDAAPRLASYASAMARLWDGTVSDVAYSSDAVGER